MMNRLRTILTRLGVIQPARRHRNRNLAHMAELCGGPLDGEPVDAPDVLDVIYAKIKTVYVNGDPRGFEYLAKYERDDTGGVVRFCYMGEVKRKAPAPSHVVIDA